MKFCLLLFICICFHAGYSQCGTPITTFPFTENFESSNGSWTTGGNKSDWVWGTPNKKVIKTTIAGTKCWMTGGLGTAGYNDGENAWLQSPCFDLSTLTHPFIRFNIFWETERKYDGLTLEYSINNGATWLLLGSRADAPNCANENWFNTDNITALGKDGWSGNIQATAACTGGAGNGSGEWKLAQKAIPELAGKANVIFRFRFAAGTQCNNYDGIAIDNFMIGNDNQVDFTYTCSPGRIVSFSPVIGAGYCIPAVAWNFNDPATGTSTSPVFNASHAFSGPGSYNVTLSFPGSSPAITPIVKSIKIVDVSLSEISGISCKGESNAVIGATAIPAGAYTYTWNTTPVKTGSILSDVAAGSYTVTVTGDNACPVENTINVGEPLAINYSWSINNAYCGQPTGAVKFEIIGGGTPPYNFIWEPAVSTSNEAINLLPGNYKIIIGDDNNCKDTLLAEVKDLPFQISLGNDTVICKDQQLVLDPGPFASYQWQDNSTERTFTVTGSGKYFVRVTDFTGCIATDTIEVTVDCEGLLFPTAFTPNNDGRNDQFGPLGKTWSAKNYSLKIYNRWGEIVFQSKDPNAKWDGKINSRNSSTATYVWIANYTIGSRSFQQKGSFLLVK